MAALGHCDFCLRSPQAIPDPQFNDLNIYIYCQTNIQNLQSSPELDCECFMSAYIDSKYISKYMSYESVFAKDPFPTSD